MSDNTPITPGTGAKVASDEVTYSGDTASVQLVRLVDVSGAEGSKTVGPLTQPVSLVSLPALAAGSNVIGSVTQWGTWTVAGSGNFAITAAALPLPTGAAQDATLTGGTQRAKLTDGTNNAAVKAASTAAVATDPALVVTVSPNNAVAATQSGAWNLTNITGTVSLPTGAATSANQTTLNTAIGAQGDTSATTDTGTFSLIALFKRALGYLSTIAANAASTADSPVEAHQPADVITFTPTLDTAIYASGDVLFATAAITGVTRGNDLRAILTSLVAIDKSKQAPAITIYFYQTNVTSAAANAANNMSDADAITCLGFVDILTADWKTLANNSFLCYSGAKAPNLLLEAATGTTTVFAVGILTAGTPTFAVGDLVLKLGVVQS